MRENKGEIAVKASSQPSLLALLDTLEPLDEDFPEIDDRPPEPAILADTNIIVDP